MTETWGMEEWAKFNRYASTTTFADFQKVMKIQELAVPDGYTEAELEKRFNYEKKQAEAMNAEGKMNTYPTD